MRRVLLVGIALLAAGCGSTTRVPPHRFESKAYLAGIAFAQCMREHGVAHPNPDRSGDFRLTPKQEQRMRASATPKEHEAAEKACFHLLKGTVSTKPLSKAAQRAALGPLRDLKGCLAEHGYHVGKPIVKVMSRGRAMFGFDRATRTPPAVQHACERQVHLAQRIDQIIKIDRAEGG
jgi:hypothetical protein